MTRPPPHSAWLVKAGRGDNYLLLLGPLPGELWGGLICTVLETKENRSYDLSVSVCGGVRDWTAEADMGPGWPGLQAEGV